MIKAILTAKDTAFRLSETDSILVQNKKATATLSLNPKQRYQTIFGFGGAFTESACYNLYRVNEEVREKALELYFDPEKGLGYTIGRVSIHGCDFSLSSYTYIEEGDAELKTFDVSRDLTYVVPIIRQAEQIAKQPIQLLGSPWTPPAFMKDNNSPIRGGHLLPEYRDAWAKYYVRFVEEYRKLGMTIWGITVQNEPAAVQRWDSCIFSAEEERDFVKYHLGPIMKNSSASDVNILVWDHNRDVIVERVTPILSDPEAAQYVWGTGFHWYVSEAFENVGKVHELFPDKGLLFTEGCVEMGVHLNNWTTGERYARNMIGDLENFCEGYLDWNLYLDNLGGPNHVNNVCDAPIIIDIFPEKLILESSYYYIGHISKFVRPGAVRIQSTSTAKFAKIIAFENLDGSLAVIVFNETDQSETISL
ncbi:MAG: glycoside hydrolase family 30 protein, partial [Candidatus Izemoplasmatales bacterium]|nr:glycoside hydrolase family 30 protein [Candidatus Izemoplasmatales bacterium]